MTNEDLNLIKSKDRVKKYGEVFTPQRVVEEMCNNLPNDAWKPETTFLEPTCGEGVFVVEILKRKFKRCKTRKDFSIALNSVYAMDIQADNVDITIKNVIALCKDHFSPTKKDIETINDHIIMCDSLKVMKLLNNYTDKGESNGTE